MRGARIKGNNVSHENGIQKTQKGACNATAIEDILNSYSTLLLSHMQTGQIKTRRACSVL